MKAYFIHKYKLLNIFDYIEKIRCIGFLVLIVIFEILNRIKLITYDACRHPN